VVLHVTRDSTAPDLNVDQVPEATREAVLHVTGSIVDARDLAHLLVNGWHVVVRDDGTFNATMGLEVGLNDVVVRAEDLAGNAVRRSFVVERTEAPPPPVEQEGESPWIVALVLVVAVIAGFLVMMMLGRFRERGGD
jgi:hypothetical protein